MKYTVMDCPGVERYEVAKFFWLEDAFEYHVAHGFTELYYDGQKISELSIEDRMSFVREPKLKNILLETLGSQCKIQDLKEWKRVHPEPVNWQPLQPPPMKSFGDPNWYRQGGTTAPAEFHQYVTTGDSGTKSSMGTGGPNTTAST